MKVVLSHCHRRPFFLTHIGIRIASTALNRGSRLGPLGHVAGTVEVNVASHFRGHSGGFTASAAKTRSNQVIFKENTLTTSCGKRRRSRSA